MTAIRSADGPLGANWFTNTEVEAGRLTLVESAESFCSSAVQ